MAQRKIIPPLKNLTIGQLLYQVSERYGDSLACNRSGVAWTYRELDYYSDAVAAGLLSLGVKRKDHVAIVTELEPESLLIYYAVQKIGAVAVMICTSLPPEETARQTEECEARFLVLGTSLTQDLLEGFESLPRSPKLEQVIYIGQRMDTPYPGLCQLLAMGAQVPAEQLEAAKKAVKPKDTCSILFTSGTTSRPKMVMTDHFARVNNGIQTANDMGCTNKDRFMVTTPMFHCFCISANIMAACAAGACLCIPETRHTTHILQMIERERCTVFSGVPTMFHAVMCQRNFDSYDLSSLRTGLIGGSTYPVELFIQIEQKMGFTLLSSLGQTEATAGLTCSELTDSLEVRSTTVGHWMGHLEGCIKDVQTGKPLPQGQAGEVCIRGYTLMQGYYLHPELTAKAIDPEGWLHTGDMGLLDERGYLHLRGRLKDLIIRGGENIGPPEIENLISQIPGVKECKVIGVPDNHYGEEVCACISMYEGTPPPDADAVRDVIRANLAEFKVPRYVLFFDELPHNATGKIAPNDLHTLVEKKMNN